MDDATLDALISALSVTPDNRILRVQVVRELLRSRRWEQAEELGKPLLATPERPLGLLAGARGALTRGDKPAAGRYYREALELDRGLVDEALEAELEEQDVPSRLTVEGLEDDPSSVSERPRISFRDVGGMEALKEQIRLNILYPMQKPEIYQAYGKKIGGGILMFGPPGCGKTFLSRATAGEMGARFFTLTLNDTLNMWMGESEKHLANLFATARAQAPSVIFIDEVDALGGKRSDMRSASTRSVVSQLLVELDGISSQNDKVLVLGATNMPWNVDVAMRRPGRFDRVLFVPPPDLEAREEILKVQTRGRKLAPGLSFSDTARKTELFSGADLNNLVERATERALADALKSGNLRDVTQADFAAALKEVKPSTTEWLRRSKNYVTFANQDGLYEDLARYLDEVRIR